jgi:hypothetical protein
VVERRSLLREIHSGHLRGEPLTASLSMLAPADAP